MLKIIHFTMVYIIEALHFLPIKDARPDFFFTNLNKINTVSKYL